MIKRQGQRGFAFLSLLLLLRLFQPRACIHPAFISTRYTIDGCFEENRFFQSWACSKVWLARNAKPRFDRKLAVVNVHQSQPATNETLFFKIRNQNLGGLSATGDLTGLSYGPYGKLEFRSGPLGRLRMPSELEN